MILLTRNYLMVPHLNFFFGDENIDEVLNSGRAIASQFHPKSINRIFHTKKDTFQNGVYRIKMILKAQCSIQNSIFKSYIFKKSTFSP